MNTLVLIGLALVVAGLVLLAVRFAPRARRQLATTATQPRTVADLVRLREETDGSAGSMQPASPAPSLVGAAGSAAPPARPTPATRPTPAARPAPPAPRMAPATAAAQVASPPSPKPPSPAFVPPAPRATPVGGRLRKEPADPPPPPLDGDDSPWQRGARMAAGLGGGQPWREPPAPAAPLRIVPAAEPAAAPPVPVEIAAPIQPAEPLLEEPAESETPDADAPVRLVPTEPASPPEEAIDPVATPASDTPAEQAPFRLVPPAAPEAEQPASIEPAEPAVPDPDASHEPAPTAARPQAVWIEPGAVGSAGTDEDQGAPEPVAAAEPAPPAAEESEVQASADGESMGPESSPLDPPAAPASEVQVPAAAAMGGAALAAAGLAAVREPAESRSEEPVENERLGQIPTPGGWDDMEAEDVRAGAVPDRFADDRAAASDEQATPRRDRQTPDERAAEQAAADLALLRTFGFADPGLRPDSAPVVAMERPEEQEPPVEAGDDAQPVRYRVIRRDGSVVGGATVTLLDDRGGDVAASTADAEGRGEMLAPASGGYVLVSTAAGHQPGAVAITVAGSASEADVLIARSASVSGSVHGEDGPIGGARVTLVQDGEAVDAVDTSADGTYRIDDIGAGEYGLSVAAAGCAPVASLLDVAEEAAVRHDVELRSASPVADGGLVDDDAMSGLR